MRFSNGKAGVAASPVLPGVAVGESDRTPLHFRKPG
jgi:hypothetical protein